MFCGVVVGMIALSVAAAQDEKLWPVRVLQLCTRRNMDITARISTVGTLETKQRRQCLGCRDASLG